MRPLRYPQQILQARRLLLVGDGSSSLLRVQPAMRRLFRRLLRLPVLRPLPLDQLTRPLGFVFAVGTVLSTRTNPLDAPVRWRGGASWLLRRGTVLHPIKHSRPTQPAPRPTSQSAVLRPPKDSWPPGWRVLATTQRGTWFSPTLTPIFRASGQHTDPFSPPPTSKQQGGLPVVVASPRVFAVADIEPFTNKNFSSRAAQVMFQRLLRWLRSPRRAPRP